MIFLQYNVIKTFDKNRAESNTTKVRTICLVNITTFWYWNSLPNAVFAASSAKNFKMNVCKANLDRFLIIVE